jgi:hypothetical protein
MAAFQFEYHFGYLSVKNSNSYPKSLRRQYQYHFIFKFWLKYLEKQVIVVW